jgi:mRNA interferase MazF
MSSLEQGDIIEVDFTPAVGHEPAKLRPAIVVSEYGFNSRSSLVALIPISSTDNGYPLHVKLRSKAVTGFAVVEGLRTLDVAQRGYTLLGSADDTAMRTIMTNIRSIFGLR